MPVYNMDHQPAEIPGLDRNREKRQWILAAVFGVLFLACLALWITAAGPGFNIHGQQTRIRLVSAVNHYPFCPPEIPCPISALTPRNHWTVWAITETISMAGIGKDFQTLFSIPLFW